MPILIEPESRLVVYASGVQADQDKRPERDDLHHALRGDQDTLRRFLEEAHAADLAEWMEDLGDAELARVLQVLDVEAWSEVMKFADDDVGARILGHLSHDQVVAVVEELPADEVVDLLALTDDERTEQILRSVDFERAQGLRKLALYDEDSAGGMMTVEYVSVGAEANVGDAIKLIKSEDSPAAEEAGGVFVVDPSGAPIGYVSDRELLTTPIHTAIRDVMEENVITVRVNADREEVGRLFLKYSFSAVPVVDMRGALIGVISDEDAQEVIQEETQEDFTRLIGTSPEELQTRLPVLQRVRHRIPLQVLTVAGGLLISWALAKVFPSGETGEPEGVDLLRYLPIIVGLSGNVGVQSSTILVRAFATGELTREDDSSVLRAETLVGFLIGIICGLAVMSVAALTESVPSPWHFGFAIGLAVSVAVTWASVLGCVVPIGCQRLGIDPAIVAGPFLITLSDISGTMIFVGIAWTLLGLGAT